MHMHKFIFERRKEMSVLKKKGSEEKGEYMLARIRVDIFIHFECGKNCQITY